MIIHLDEVSGAVFHALQRTHAKYEDLGPRGAEKIRKNQFGDTALHADIACEKEVIDTYREGGLCAVVHSEEHGTVELGGSVKYLAVLDGVDGTAGLVRHFEMREQGVHITAKNLPRYGTMTAIFQGADPTYSDALCGGVMEHSTGDLYFFRAGHGAFRFNVMTGDIASLRTSSTTHLDDVTRVHTDAYWPTVRETFVQPLEGFPFTTPFASEEGYVDVASGKTELALECTRKGNLEIAAAYGLIREAGGVMITLDGKDIGPQRYRIWSQDTPGKDVRTPIITAANMPLAQELIRLLKQRKSI